MITFPIWVTNLLISAGENKTEQKGESQRAFQFRFQFSSFFAGNNNRKKEEKILNRKNKRKKKGG